MTAENGLIRVQNRNYPENDSTAITNGEVATRFQNLPQMLRQQADSRPDSIAVVGSQGAMSYRELVRRSSQLERYLRSLPVATDDRIGLFVESSLDLMVGTWGVLFAGCGYVPLAPEYPEERLRYMIEDSGLKVIFTQAHLRAKALELAVPGVKVVTLEEATVFAERADALAAPVAEEDFAAETLAYVIYTSGTTGKPKGVAIEHGSIVNQMVWLKSAFDLDERRVILRKTPMSFDAAQWELLAVACGSRVVMGKPDIYRDPAGLIETIEEFGVTTLQGVPTLLQALVDNEDFARCDSLVQIFSGGEALSKKLAIRCLEVKPGAKLVNLYGPTECTINATAYVVDLDTVKDGPNVIPIGRPVAHTSLYVLDDQLQPVPTGTPGELFIGGRQLARGYLHRPEQTAEKFITATVCSNGRPDRLYRTGDLAQWNEDGSVQFVGRMDNQVKLRGYRVELDEVRLAIENHDWVKSAAVLVREDSDTGHQSLVACLELNLREAALMDQGNHGSHHLSKKGRVQVRAQLSNQGLRQDGELAGKPIVRLLGAEATEAQRRLTFARKTYRFFEGGATSKTEVLGLLRRIPQDHGSRELSELTEPEFGSLLRYFGQYSSGERLLPKYGYASPGALYATQLYLEINGIAGIKAGYYYYHPIRHELVLVTAKAESETPGLTLHFVGKKPAIEAVYRNNVLEVLEMETGHMLGHFDEVLPEFGLGIGAGSFDASALAQLKCPAEHHYLAAFEVVPAQVRVAAGPVDTYLQVHSALVDGLAPGHYRFDGEALQPVAVDVVRKKDVIAINQQVYERSSLGISVISRSGQDWAQYIDLGRRLQALQLNDLGFGFMSSGYSSKSGNDLLSARRINSVLESIGESSGPSYFFLGGRVSEEQLLSEGMREDAVHSKGPSELIKQDIANFLPSHMVPSRLVIFDRLPLSASGKVDVRALESSAELANGNSQRVMVAPRTTLERQVAKAWSKVMKTENVSVRDEFFESGGKSLLAVVLVQEINRSLAATLPLQVIFDAPTIEALAQRLDDGNAEHTSRLVPLQPLGADRPIYCWPGLGGYPMNLRALARNAGVSQPFFGVQARGINAEEIPFASISEMAAADVEMIRQHQPTGPYTLWGYSFGARVAFETAYQLEQSGEVVDGLFLIAPGSPTLRAEAPIATAASAGVDLYQDKAFVTILFSVFAGAIDGPDAARCLLETHDEASFAEFILAGRPELDAQTVRRIIQIVELTYSFKYTFQELREKTVSAPITIFKAQGDDYSFLEDSLANLPTKPTVVELEADHYSLLREPQVQKLTSLISLHRDLSALVGQQP